MTRRRRTFDVDLPDEGGPAAAGQPGGRRRGPMASAIAENAEAGQERSRAARAIREENDALAHEYVALRNAGHVIRPLPLGDVHETLLTRERLTADDAELDELVASIRDIGLSNPIRVLERPDGEGYELVQGHRRLGAYRRLFEETGDGRWASVPAAVIPDGPPDVAGLYRRMVDENVVRKDISFAEMAHAARNFAADPATGTGDVDRAVAELFKSASYSKRSRIRSFVSLLDRLGDVLAHPAEISRNLGAALEAAMKRRPALAAEIRAALADGGPRAAREELGILRRFAGVPDGGGAGDGEPAPEGAGKPPRRPEAAGQGGRTKTTFHIESAAGQVKCTAAPGRLEIKAARDFSSIDRRQLERAITSLVDDLG